MEYQSSKEKFTTESIWGTPNNAWTTSPRPKCAITLSIETISLSMIHSFTRQELYDLIWSEPVSVVTKRLGSSDVWLRKNCITADIPLPPAGFWANKRAGKAMRKINLPQRGLGQFDVIEIGRRPHYWYP
jgi:hypothetical protein